MRIRFLTVLLAASCLCLPTALGADSNPLSGHYSGSNGNSIQLTQDGSSIKWVAVSANGDWVHDFDGTLSDKTISGRFQDRDGYTLHQSGDIHARVDDVCHFTITYVKVDGQAATSGGEVFTMDDCTVPATKPPTSEPPSDRSVVHWKARGNASRGTLAFFVTSKGKATANADGQIGAGGGSALGTLLITVRRTHRNGTSEVVEHIQAEVLGPGNFDRPRLKLVVRVKHLVVGAFARRCRMHPLGTLTLLSIRGSEDRNDATHVSGLCGLKFTALDTTVDITET